jgi:hypothetical protein
MSIVIFSYSLLLLIVSVIGIIRYKKFTPPFKILAWSVIAICLLSILSRIWSIKYRNNAPILQIQCIAEYIFYSLVYYYLFKNKKVKKIIVISIVVMAVSFFINALFFQPFLTIFPTNIYLPAQILFAIFSLLLFKEMLLYPLKINIIRQSVFWYNTAMLFYATTMFFNLGLSNYLAKHNLYDLIITYFWYLIIYLFHIFICIALLTENKKNTLSDAG